MATKKRTPKKRATKKASPKKRAVKKTVRKKATKKTVKRRKLTGKKTKTVKEFAVKNGFVLPHGYEAIVRKRKPTKKTTKK